MSRRGLLDTNIMILRSRIAPDELPDEMAISAVTLAELSAGPHEVRPDTEQDAYLEAAERARRLDVLQRAEHEFDPISFDADAARAYGRVTAEVVAARTKPRRRAVELMIAATAIALELQAKYCSRGLSGKEIRMAAGPEEIPVGLSPYEVAVQLRGRIQSSLDYMHIRKKRFRTLSSGIKVLSLAISASATIILGLQDLSLWAGLGFSLVALVTVINAIEPFFNWRSRWVLAEEAQYRFHRVKDDLDYLVATRSREELQVSDLSHLHERYEDNWRKFSEEWLENRRRGN